MHQLKARLRRANNNRRYNAVARKMLAGLHANLDEKDRKLCDAYAVEALGSSGYAPWLYVYSAVAGGFREGWIPDNYYKQYVVWPSSYTGMSSKRALGRHIFGDGYFPDLAYIVDGSLMSVTGATIKTRPAAEALFAESGQVIFKADSSLQGLGIRFFSKDAFDAEMLKSLGNGAIQKVIKQHPIFDDISRNALATIRLTTALDIEGTPTIRGSYLRLGRQADTHVKSASAIVVAFDSKTGELSAQGYAPDWNPTTAHPDSGAAFDGIKIPNIGACADLVLALHRKFPLVECLGWDLAVDQSGRPHVLEWNSGHNGIKFTEATQGPCFADLDWVDRWREQ